MMSVGEITKSGHRIEGGEQFYSLIGDLGIKGASSEILKIETRQHYDQHGNSSFDAWMSGKFEEAVQLLRDSVKEDIPFYHMLARKGVFIYRYRPVCFPITDYLAWELRHYQLNIKLGERIFLCRSDEWEAASRRVISHDFMIFDSRVAFIHDYDQEGRINGGWHVDNVHLVGNLYQIATSIRVVCQPFDKFIESAGIDLGARAQRTFGNS